METGAYFDNSPTNDYVTENSTSDGMPVNKSNAKVWAAKYTHTQRQRERERERETHTHTQRERERERERDRDTHTHTHKPRTRAVSPHFLSYGMSIVMQYFSFKCCHMLCFTA